MDMEHECHPRSPPHYSTTFPQPVGSSATLSPQPCILRDSHAWLLGPGRELGRLLLSSSQVSPLRDNPDRRPE